MQENTCQIHFEPIVLKDNNNQYQCKTCIENECFDRMIKVEKAIIEYKEILNQSKDKDEIIKIQKTIDLISKYKLDLPQLFNERRIQQQQQLQQTNIVKEHIYKQFNYKLINEYPNMYCYCSFVFNQDSTRLFIGQTDGIFGQSNNDIQVYEFKNGELKNQLQTLKQHTKRIFCLIYMNKSNLLVSGSNDYSIVIWNQDQNDSWKLQQILEGHSSSIYCLINNEDEDNLISGSYDKSITFWKKTNMNWCCQQTIQTEFEVYSLSLSKSQTKLISCGWYSNQILIMEQKQDQQWIISQTINTNTYGQHVLFISDNQFVYQGQQDYLQKYLYDQEKKQYIQDKQINVQKYYGYDFVFPCKYIEQKNIFIIKNGSFLNCFRIVQQQYYILQQSIEYNNHFIGNISNNGQYIITQEDNQNKIEVRELQYLE